MSPALGSPALCAHFGECGGCKTQDLAYSEQLARKENELRDLFGAHWTDAIEVRPSPDVWHYRNKVDFNFARKRYDEPPPKGFVRETVLGFNRVGKWYWPLDMMECRIGPAGVDGLLGAVREWYRTERLDAFDSRTKEGFLRALLVREGKRTGEQLVMAITTDGPFPAASFIEAVQSVYPDARIQRGVFRGLSQGSSADEFEALTGDPWITEELHIPTDTGARRLSFRISPFSFFQTNTRGAEVLYGEIRRWVAKTPPDVLYDLYGGAGGIAFACADLAKVVRSVESVPEASADGVDNARSNGIDNVYFTTDKVKNYLQELRNAGGMEASSAAIVDPPRAGMEPKSLRRLIECGPPRLLYVSCKPSALAQEMPTLHETYALTELSAVDLFPHTPHVEVLAGFVRRVGR